MSGSCLSGVSEDLLGRLPDCLRRARSSILEQESEKSHRHAFPFDTLTKCLRMDCTQSVPFPGSPLPHHVYWKHTRI